MRPTRVGTVCHPQRFGRRSVAVYENNKGFFVKIDGVQKKLRGSVRWITCSGVQMKGHVLFISHQEEHRSSESSNEIADLDEHDIQLAIELSLNQNIGSEERSEEASADRSSSGSRSCVVCLQEDAACMLCVPCNHMVSCQVCAPRLKGLPCPICRRNVTRVTRVFF